MLSQILLSNALEKSNKRNKNLIKMTKFKYFERWKIKL